MAPDTLEEEPSHAEHQALHGNFIMFFNKGAGHYCMLKTKSKF
jgi:hypothetical protein